MDITGDNKHTIIATVILEALGGAENIVFIDYCSTRLRLELKDSTITDDKKIKSVTSGLLKPTKTSIQIIVEPTVEFVANELKRLTGI